MRYLFLVSLISMSLLTFSQPREYIGFVFDENTQKPIDHVQIKDETQPGNVILTDSTGKFRLVTSAKEITLVHVGYEDELVSLTGFTNGSRIFMKMGGNLLDVSVVGADRAQRAMKHQIVSVEVLSPDIVLNKNVTNIDEALNQVSGVQISEGQIIIRNGAGWSYGAGSRALVMVDGLPLLSGDAGSVQWNFIPTDNIESVEVVKGASSVLYGSSALNGIINIQTKWPGAKPETKITAFTGMYSDGPRPGMQWTDKTLTLSGVRLTHRRKIKKTEVVLSGEVIDDTGYRFGDSRARQRVGVDLRHQLKDRMYAGVRAHVLRTENGSFLLWRSYDSAYNAFQDMTTITTGTKFRVDPFFTYVTKKGWSHKVHSRFLTIDNNVDNGNPLNDQSNTNRMLYVDYQSKVYLGPLGKITYGYTQSGVTSNSPLYGDVTHQASNRAFYAQLDKRFKKFSLTLGARQEKYTLDDYEETKPVYRAGLNYNLGKASFFRASYGQGFRFPTIAETFITTNVGLISIFPNPTLKSETGNNLEFGLKQGFKIKKLKGYFDVALFQMKYQNMMDFTFAQWSKDNSPQNGFGVGFKSVNTGNTTIEGIEISGLAEMRIRKGKLTLFGGYLATNPTIDMPGNVFATDSFGKALTYLNTSYDTTGYFLKYRSLKTFKLDAVYKLDKWDFGTSFRYASRLQNIDNAFTDGIFQIFVPGIKQSMQINPNGYWIMDVRIGYELNKKVRLSLVSNNLTNVEYVVRPSDIGPPRLTQMQVRVTL